MLALFLTSFLTLCAFSLQNSCFDMQAAECSRAANCIWNLDIRRCFTLSVLRKPRGESEELHIVQIEFTTHGISELNFRKVYQPFSDGIENAVDQKFDLKLVEHDDQYGKMTDREITAELKTDLEEAGSLVADLSEKYTELIESIEDSLSEAGIGGITINSKLKIHLLIEDDTGPSGSSGGGTHGVQADFIIMGLTETNFPQVEPELKEGLSNELEVELSDVFLIGLLGKDFSIIRAEITTETKDDANALEEEMKEITADIVAAVEETIAESNTGVAVKKMERIEYYSRFGYDPVVQRRLQLFHADRETFSPWTLFAIGSVAGFCFGLCTAQTWLTMCLYFRSNKAEHTLPFIHMSSSP